MKKAFSLVELVIVIAIIGITYSLVLTSDNFKSKEHKEKLTLFNIKKHLMDDYKFKNMAMFFCIEKDLSCYVAIDNKVLKDSKIVDFFKTKPEVYQYNDNFTKIEFSPIKIDNFNERVIFEVSIDKDYTSRDFILEYEDRYFLFNSIYDTPTQYDSYNDIFNKNQAAIQEIKYAF